MRRVNNITEALARHLSQNGPGPLHSVINLVIKANLSPRGVTQISLNLASDLQEDSTALTRISGRTRTPQLFPRRSDLSSRDPHLFSRTIKKRTNVSSFQPITVLHLALPLYVGASKRPTFSLRFSPVGPPLPSKKKKPSRSQQGRM